jgi:predicted PhzF superfamily epimerase YddE/YHI9
MRIFQVDAFTSRLFAGNPAAVVIMDDFLSDTTLQAIAAENNLAETAFLVFNNGEYDLRWFTPRVEVPLCGHATLASAAVVMERLEPGRERVVFRTASGLLPVQRVGSGYLLDFPARTSEPIETPGVLASGLKVVPVEVLMNQFNYMAVLSSERQLLELDPDWRQSHNWTALG